MQAGVLGARVESRGTGGPGQELALSRGLQEGRWVPGAATRAAEAEPVWTPQDASVAAALQAVCEPRACSTCPGRLPAQDGFW